MKYVIDEVGKSYSDIFDKMTAINLYHRLLECYLYRRQINQNFVSMR